MVSITLNPAEFAEVELPCDDTLSALTARAVGASGKCRLDVQASRDGLTWASPIAYAWLTSKTSPIRLNLPERTRKIRALIHNTAAEAAHVEIDEVEGSQEG